MGRAGADTVGPLVLAGRLDGRCTIELRALLETHVARNGDEDVLLDMSGVESLDLTVLRLLAGVAMRLRRDGRRLVLVGCTASLRRLLSHGIWRRLFVVVRDAPEGLDSVPDQHGR